MNSISAVQVSGPLVPLVRNDALVSEQPHHPPQAPVHDTAADQPQTIIELTLCNPILESLYAAYDNRGVHQDSSPRGVEIDRIEMIKQGFDHIRDIIETISETAAEDMSPQQQPSVDISA